MEKNLYNSQETFNEKHFGFGYFNFQKNMFYLREDYRRFLFNDNRIYDPSKIFFKMLDYHKPNER